MAGIKLHLKPGKYGVAVSGGVDSMVLLDVARQESELEVVVAHFNHGIRADSAKDEELVTRTARGHDLRVEVGHGNLGPRPSENTARQARYAFLLGVKKKHKAKAILTAHHQDDLLETAVINILRGSGRRGISAIAENPEVVRPLLNTPKTTLIGYAKRHKLVWHDDETNKDEVYLRNYIRKHVLNNMTAGQRSELLENIDKVAKIGKTQDKLIATVSRNIYRNKEIDRSAFISLPTGVANELLIYWLREVGYRSYDRNTIERLNTALRTARTGTKYMLSDQLELVIGKSDAYFELKR